MSPGTGPGAGTVLPPRPNLGPEPWPESPWPRGWIAAALALLIVAALGLLRWRRRARPAAPATGPDGTEPGPLDPQQRLIRAAEAARSALVARLGPTWSARTTEEVAGSAEPVDWLGPERAGRLVELLRLADRAKFADEAIADHQPQGPDDWEAFASALAVEAREGPTSRIKGA